MFLIATWNIVSYRVSQLRRECLLMEIGQIFITYQIPLNVRAQITGVNCLKGLLQFIFRNSNCDMAIKLHDAYSVFIFTVISHIVVK